VKRSILTAAAAVALAGCAAAPKPLYHWEGYQRLVYEHLKGGAVAPAEQLATLQAQAEKAKAIGAALPPGFRAHMAMLRLQLGEVDEAHRLIDAEKAAFPESIPYMDFVLKSLGRKQS
jgi:hypothetical protein